MGVFIGLGQPQHQDDWLGLGAIVPVLICLLVGCVLSVVAAGVSMARKENRWPTAVFVGFFAAGFLIWAGAEYVAARGNEERQMKERAASYRREADRNASRDARVKIFLDRIRSEPDVLTSERFWSENGTDHEIEGGVIEFLHSGGQLSDAQAKGTLRYGPWVWPHLLHAHTFPSETLLEIAADESYNRDVRDEALKRFLQGGQFVVTPELKALVEGDFLLQIDPLFAKGAWTREEIEEHVKRPVENLYVRMAFQRELKRLQGQEKK